MSDTKERDHDESHCLFYCLFVVIFVVFCLPQQGIFFAYATYLLRVGIEVLLITVTEADRNSIFTHSATIVEPGKRKYVATRAGF